MSAPDVSVPTMSTPDLRSAIISRLSGSTDGQGGPLQTAAPEQVEQPAPQPIAEPAAPPPAPTPEAPAAAETAPPDAGAVEIEDNFDLGLDGDEPPATQEIAAEVPAEQTTPPANRAEAEKEIGALLATPRGRRIYAHHKALAELSKPPEEGGIGMEPTVAQLREFHSSHVEHARLLDDMGNPSPQVQMQIAAWLSEQSPTLVRALPQYLAQVNPPAFVEIAQTFGSHIAAELRSAAAQEATEEGKARLADAANLVDFINGRNPQASQPAAGDEDPEKQELRARLARYEQSAQQNQTGTQQQLERRAAGIFYQKLGESMSADAHKALAAIKPTVDDVTYAAYHAKLLESMKATTQSALRSNEVVKIATQRAIRDAAASRNLSSIEKAVMDARRIYAPKLTEERVAYIRAAGVRIKERSDASSAKLQQSQGKVEPPPTSAAAPAQNGASVPARKDGEANADYMRRVIQHKLTAQ